MPRKIPVYKPWRPPGASTARRLYERRPSRQEDKDFYKSPAWRAVRISNLRDNPLCEECQRIGRTAAAEHVHHVLDRKLRPDLALDKANLESLCGACHNRKRRVDP